MKSRGNRKIGIFDSGVGGLIVTRAIMRTLPDYDYVYLGDTKRVPYGNRSHETVYEFTRQAIEYLFEKENCELVILACNTASARALRRLQQEYLPEYIASGNNFSSSRNTSGSSRLGKVFPSARILGVLIPAAEEAAKYKKVGVLATVGTVNSKTFIEEIKKLNNKARVYQNPAPMLVPLIESGEVKMAEPFVKKYLQPLLNKKIDALILGCTHYPILKKEIKKFLPKKTKIISQDEMVPEKLKDYLLRHPEIEGFLSKKSSVKLLFTDITPQVSALTEAWFNQGVNPGEVVL